MRDLNEMQVFAAVADAQSFDAAARRLGLSPSTVSRRVAQLERRLGVALLQRTTRSVRLTGAGLAYRGGCGRVLAAAAEADETVATHRDGLRGELVVNAPLLFGQAVVAPFAAAFASRHPHVRLHLELTNALADPVETGADVVIRSVGLKDSTLRARLLAEAPSAVVAAPALLATHPAPASLDELAALPCLVFGGAQERHWRIKHPQRPTLAVKAVFTSNNLDVIRSAALAGLGFALLPRFVVHHAIADGRLAALALGAALGATRLHALFPGHAIANAGARTFVDELRDHLAGPLGWG